MRDIIRIVLLVINIISFVLVAIFGMTGIIYEIFGPAAYEKMHKRLKIPWNFDKIWIFMFVCLAVLIITYFIRIKFFER